MVKKEVSGIYLGWIPDLIVNIYKFEVLQFFIQSFLTSCSVQHLFASLYICTVIYVIVFNVSVGRWGMSMVIWTLLEFIISNQLLLSTSPGRAATSKHIKLDQRFAGIRYCIDFRLLFQNYPNSSSMSTKMVTLIDGFAWVKKSRLATYCYTESQNHFAQIK